MKHRKAVTGLIAGILRIPPPPPPCHSDHTSCDQIDMKGRHAVGHNDMHGGLAT